MQSFPDNLLTGAWDTSQTDWFAHAGFCEYWDYAVLVAGISTYFKRGPVVNNLRFWLMYYKKTSDRKISLILCSVTWDPLFSCLNQTKVVSMLRFTHHQVIERSWMTPKHYSINLARIYVGCPNRVKFLEWKCFTVCWFDESNSSALYIETLRGRRDISLQTWACACLHPLLSI